MLLVLLLLALPARGGAAPPVPDEALFVFSWRGLPVGTVHLALSPGARAFTYTSSHLHTREGHVGQVRREVRVPLGPEGRVEGRSSVPQALWLWHGPPALGCVTGREELSGQEGPQCVTAVRGRSVEGRVLGQPFQATYDAQGRMVELVLGDSRFAEVPPGTPLRAPPELFADGVPVGGAEGGPLAFSPPWPVETHPAWLTEWTPGAARALAERVHAAFPEKGPGAADWREGGAAEEGEAGGCLAHASRYAALAAARGQRVALVHGLLVVDGGPARPHAWVRVGLAGGRTVDLDPTSLDEVLPETHLPLAVVEPGGASLEAGERWLALLRGEHRVVRVSRRE